jgi:hypothetical protein
MKQMAQILIRRKPDALAPQRRSKTGAAIERGMADSREPKNAPALSNPPSHVR